MLLLVCYLPPISVPTVRIPDKEDQNEDEDEDDNVEVSADGKHEDATQHNYHLLKAGGQRGSVSSVSAQTGPDFAPNRAVGGTPATFFSPRSTSLGNITLEIVSHGSYS